MSMKILLFNPWSPEAGGGIDRWLIEITRYLSANNDVALVYFDTTFDEPRRLHMSSIRKHLEGRRTFIQSLSAYRLPPFGKPALPSPLAFKMLLSWAQWADVICFQEFYLTDLLFFLLKLLTNKPIIVSWQIPLLHFGKKTTKDKIHNFYVLRTSRLFAKNSNRHIVNNKEDKSLLNMLDINKVDVVPQGIDLTHFVPKGTKASGGPFNVLFVGRFSYQKGVDVLCDAIRQLNVQKMLEMEFTFIGSGGESVAINRLADDSYPVKALGFVDDTDLISEYQRAHLLVMPSRWESFGLVALEAQACGTPVVASNLIGLKDIVTQNTGKLVAVEDSKAIAKAISWFFDMWKYRNSDYLQLCSNCRANVNRFSWQNMAHSYLKILQDATK
jgi:glycosyltransferase involved in cell wall biosynthesis